MRAITVCQPFAWAIIYGAKRVENRSWHCGYRGPLLIHAGKSRDWLEDDLELPDGSKHAPIAALTFGAIIGVVDMVDCVPVAKVKDDPYANGKYCFKLSNPRPLEPIACRGQLALWAPPADILEAVHRAMLTTGKEPGNTSSAEPGSIPSAKQAYLF